MSYTILLVLVTLLAGNTLWAFTRNLPPPGSLRDQAFAKYVKVRLVGALVSMAAFVLIARAPLWIGATIVAIWITITVGGGWIAIRRINQ